MRISELYRPEIFSVESSETVTAAAGLLHTAQIGALPVFERGKAVGIISERDIVRAVAEGVQNGTAPVSEYMSSPPLVADVNAESMDIANRMLTAEIRHMPVVDDGAIIGMVSMRDLLAAETWS